MKKSNQKRIILIIGLVVMMTSSCRIKDEISAPKAEKIAKILSIHGHTRVDNYFWFNDRNNPKVIKYLEDGREAFGKQYGFSYLDFYEQS